MRALLVGNYGVGNFGDEALREYFVDRFPEIEWITVTAHATRIGEVSRLPLGIRSFFSTPWWKTVAAFRSCDAVVFGGGTLMTDIESITACRLWGMHAWAARVFRRPALFAFQGVGPFRSKKAEHYAWRVLQGAAFLSVRDGVSAERVKTLLPHTSIVQSFDPIILLVQKENNITRTNSVLTIIPRSNAPEGFVERAKELASSKKKPVEILSLQPFDRKEKELCQALQKEIEGATVTAITTLHELCSCIARSAYIYSARYHGAIFALALSVPFEVASQGKGDKLSSLHSSADRAVLLSLAEAGEKALRAALHGIAQRETAPSS